MTISITDLQAILTEHDFDRTPTYGDTPEDIARMEAKAEVCDAIKALIARESGN